MGLIRAPGICSPKEVSENVSLNLVYRWLMGDFLILKKYRICDNKVILLLVVIVH